MCIISFGAGTQLKIKTSATKFANILFQQSNEEATLITNLLLRLGLNYTLEFENRNI